MIAKRLPEDIKIHQILAVSLHKAAWVYRVEGDSEQMNRAREELKLEADHFPNENEIAGWWAIVLSQSVHVADKNAEESYSKLKVLSLRFPEEWKVQMAYIGGMANRMKGQYLAKDKRLSQEFESNLASAIEVGARFPVRHEVQLTVVKVASIAAGVYSGRRATDKMQSAIRIVSEIGTRFPDSREIQADFATTEVNAISSLLSLGKRSDAEEHLKAIQLLAKRFSKDKEIQDSLYEANALFLRKL